MRREFLQLAETYDPDRHAIAGFYISEKLDGTRCFWDGGLTRGIPTEQVPWASVIDPKTSKLKAKIKPVATGLWSRYGNPIVAPDWFLNALPACPLDGELWAGRGKFQLCRSICAGDEADPRFDQIQYAAYSSPALAYIFADGEIKNTNMACSIRWTEVEAWLKTRLNDFGNDFKHTSTPATFEQELFFLRENIETQNDRVFMLQQIKLPSNQFDAESEANQFLSKVLDRGGEGCVLRNPSASWKPKRHRGILKWKPFLDAEATIIGFTSGRETNKGSRLLGKIGALVVDYEGKRLELAGMTDDEREFGTLEMSRYASLNPGKDMPPHFKGKHFRPGQVVTLKFRELSDSGLPKEARYMRLRDCA